MFSKRFSAVLIVVLSILLITTGCQIKKSKLGGELTYRFIADPTSLDPALAADSESMQVVTQVFDGLVDYDSKGSKIVPAVARSWKMDDSATEFTFNLRKGVKFQNGREVKASDFKYAWERLANPKTASYWSSALVLVEGYDELQNKKAQNLNGLTTAGDYVLKVKLSQPSADFIKIIGHPALSPVPIEEINRDEKGFGEKPVGNGPFKVRRWQRGNQVMTTPFKQYYGKKPKLNALIYKVLTDDSTALREFKAGNIQVTNVPAGQLEILKKEKDVNVVISPVLATYYLGFNLAKKPWNNKKLRNALGYAIDRQDIVEKYSQDADFAATSIVPRGMPGFRENVTTFEYNPERTKKLLAESGHPGGKGLPSLTLIYNEGSGREVIAQIVQQNLNEVGLNVKIQGLESGTFEDRITSGKADFYAVSWQSDYPNMGFFLFDLFASNSSINFSGYKDKNFDKKLNQASSMSEELEREKLYQEAETLLMKQVPVVPILHETNRYVVSKNARALVWSPLGFVDTNKVWIEE